MIAGHVLHPGSASAQGLRLTAPLSFWGGTNEQGMVIDPHHPQHGTVLAGRVVLLPGSRGSSSSSSVLAEQVRTGNAPAALLLAEGDAILTLGALAAAELYDVHVPVLALEQDAFAAVPVGTDLTVTPSGHIHWDSRYAGDRGTNPPPVRE